MRKTTLFLVFLVSAFAGRGQNLVPNGDFEQYSGCPNILGQLDSALFWFNPTYGTPDYFNQCSSTTWTDVPNNYFGYQPAHSGAGYAGILPWTSFGYHEYIEVALLSPLISNQCYNFEMYINLADLYPNTTDSIQVYFSDTLYTCYLASILPLVPQISNPSGNSPDTLNWTLLAASFIATGGESYMIIGNFNNTNPTFTVYIYIDDVCLTPCTSSCTTGLEYQPQSKAIKIHPNPAKDILSINLNYPNYPNYPITLFITDIMGKQIFSQRLTTASCQLPTSKLPAGMYFVNIIGEKINEVAKFVKE